MAKQNFKGYFLYIIYIKLTCVKNKALALKFR